MSYLNDNGYNVMTLDSALQALRERRLPESAVVITFDDGFYTTYSKALPLLRKYQYPATLYLITSVFNNGKPLFNYLVAYLIWKSDIDGVDLSGLGVPGLESHGSKDQYSDEELDEIRKKIIVYGEGLSTEEERARLCVSLAELLGQNYDHLASSRAFSLVSPEELRELEESGVSIQMHSHWHRFPGLAADAEAVRLDLEKNAADIEKFSHNSPRHFCYPFGRWSEEHWELLENSGVMSAATCDRGFVYADDSPYALKRILDNDEMSQIEFEARISGFAQFAMALRGNTGRAYHAPSKTSAS